MKITYKGGEELKLEIKLLNDEINKVLKERKESENKNGEVLK